MSARRLLAGGILILSAASCNWTSFDSDSKNAPVRSIGAPDGFKSQDFGRSMLVLSGPPAAGPAAAFVASSINDTNLALVTVDLAGGVTSSTVPQTALSAVNESAISTLAEIRGVATRKLLLGTPLLQPGAVVGQTYSFDLPGGPAVAFPSVTSQEGGWGRGLTTGFLAGLATVPEIVIGSDQGLTVYVDQVTANLAVPVTTPTVGTASCDVSFDSLQDSRYALRRALVSAPLWQDGSIANSEILVSGSPHMTGSGAVSLWKVTGVEPTYTLACFAVLAPPTATPHFGQSLAVGDFDGDHLADLLVGAPPQQALVYLSTRAASGIPDPLVISDPTGLDFGFSVAALNVDGTGGDEALIGDPRAAVGGKNQAGQVEAYTYSASDGAMKKVVGKTYSDHSPEESANFGWSVNALTFCRGQSVSTTACATADTSRLLLIGAGNEVFLYYREGDNIPARTIGGKSVKDVRAP